MEFWYGLLDLEVFSGIYRWGGWGDTCPEVIGGHEFLREAVALVSVSGDEEGTRGGQQVRYGEREWRLRGNFPRV